MPLTYFNRKSSNLKTMALLICHLFISGHFRTVYISFDSSADSILLTQQLFIDLNFNCPIFVPIITTAVKSTQMPIWNQSHHSDDILQLTILDRFNQITGPSNYYSGFYQIYIISTVERNWKEDLMQQESSRSSLLLLHNPKFDTNEIYIRGYLEEPIYVTNHSLMENIFQQTFGKLESLSILSVQYSRAITCHSDGHNRRFIFSIIQKILANYYSARMNITFLQGVTDICKGGLKFNYARHRSREVYKELFFESEPLNSETMSGLNLTLLLLLFFCSSLM